ncbi:hypothetical protein [Dyadobacter sp. CY312]|uniref:hypothetical protein n=1 Tax=Dyadobacter sp. CY312 TaxID=2907303 RepID=UPI001F3E57AA|nr:hypothetical protein [Dyadobacter sp. CY312]MCE7039210.1 hypothetical protein [Dyadobacter sp. CY312]
MPEEPDTGELWNELTPEQIQDLETSYTESFHPENLIDHDEVKKEHAKWLDSTL